MRAAAKALRFLDRNKFACWLAFAAAVNFACREPLIGAVLVGLMLTECVRKSARPIITEPR